MRVIVILYAVVVVGGVSARFIYDFIYEDWWVSRRERLKHERALRIKRITERLQGANANRYNAS